MPDADPDLVAAFVAKKSLDVQDPDGYDGAGRRPR